MTESAISAGDTHPTTTVAVALPANPSRVKTKGMIHHHGSEAPTAASTAIRLRQPAQTTAMAFLTLSLMLDPKSGQLDVNVAGHAEADHTVRVGGHGAEAK